MADEVFRRDGYLSELEAGVVSVDGDRVVLDCTGFYPGGGGQVCDTGTINGFKVTEVFYEGKEIVHKVPGNDFKKGTRVWCSIDWERRLDLMMGHTAEHLLFCSLHRIDPELQITKIFISPEEKYVILNHDVSWEVIGEAVNFANDRIADNLPVRKQTMDRNDPELSKVRIKLERIPEDEEITVVSIGDIDYSACSGVHVMETGEIEMIFVDRKVSAGKDGEAVYFKVGKQARDQAAKLGNLCLQVIDECDSKQSDILKTVANNKRELSNALAALKQSAKTSLSSIEPETINGTKIYSGKVYGADRKTLGDAAEKLISQGGICVLVSVSDTVSVLMSSAIPNANCGKILPEILSKFGGRGGGKPESAQGGIPDPQDVDKLLSELTEAVKKVL